MRVKDLEIGNERILANGVRKNKKVSLCVSKRNNKDTGRDMREEETAGVEASGIVKFYN